MIKDLQIHMMMRKKIRQTSDISNNLEEIQSFNKLRKKSIYI